jgi:hypothetical protein
MQQQVSYICSKTDELIAEKHEIELLQRDFVERYSKTAARFSGKASLSKYSSNYVSIIEETQGNVALGAFSQAVISLSQGQRLIQQMESDYHRIAEAERQRQAQERARRSKNNFPGGGSGWGGGSSGGSSRSSGGSNWGGGGGSSRSSGGSSWGGGGGSSRSSGGSSWGKK